MRQFRFRVRPPDGGLTSVGRAIGESEDLHRDSLAWLNLLRDETATVVYRLSGDTSAIEPSLESASDVLAHQVFASSRDRCALYCQFEPDPGVEALIAIHDHYPVVIDLPIPVEAGGELCLTVASVQSVAEEAFAAVPDSVAVELEHVGSYRPGRPDLAGYLTERQREVLETALELGYYEVPSQVTQADIAAACDCSAGTVSTHLRKAESLLVRGVIGERDH